MRKLKFNSEPEFAEMMDVLMHEFLYDKERYVDEIINLLEKLNINKNSRILDTCAGTGFISLYLREKRFDIDCMDLSSDQIKIFQKRAEQLEVSNKIQQLSWNEIPKNYPPNSYDFLFCRGNSFIYANGGWNKEQSVDKNESLVVYQKTLQLFYNTLKKGGYLYIDKFSDSDSNHNDLIARISIGDSVEDLLFYTKRFPEKNYREARMIRRKKDGTNLSVPNITYDLKEYELESLLDSTGFRNIHKLELESEKHFTIFLAQK